MRVMKPGVKPVKPEVRPSSWATPRTARRAERRAGKDIVEEFREARRVTKTTCKEQRKPAEPAVSVWRPTAWET